jgi:hypothetical protein
MKRFLFLVSLAAASASAATAPDSIAGRVFHETGSAGAGDVRSNWDLSIIFDAAGRYSFVKFGQSSSINLVSTGPFINNPPADGTYTYTRTGDATATVALSEPGGSLKWTSSGAGISPTAVTLQLSFSSPSAGADRTGNIAAFALFDRDANLTAPAINASLRGSVSAGHALIAGFVIPGPTGLGISHVEVARDVLIRVVGPGLSQFGVNGTWATPSFRVMNSAFANPQGGAQAGDWAQSAGTAAGYQKMFSVVGAFPLPSNSKDAVTVMRLDPGAYTVVCDLAPGDAGGEALIEVYFLP